MMNGQTARHLVLRRLQLLGRELGNPELSAATDDTRLMGAAAPLDSIGLVTLIADLEGDIQAATGRPVILADEKAMSQALSPFRKVGTLIVHVESRCAQGGSSPAP